MTEQERLLARLAERAEHYERIGSADIRDVGARFTHDVLREAIKALTTIEQGGLYPRGNGGRRCCVWEGRRMTHDPILVWRFSDAPAEWRQLSDLGGGEDWLVVVPAALVADDAAWVGWLENGPLMTCNVSQHDLPDGRRVYIGAHA